jgi:hypothetical protein
VDLLHLDGVLPAVAEVVQIARGEARTGKDAGEGPPAIRPRPPVRRQGR